MHSMDTSTQEVTPGPALQSSPGTGVMRSPMMVDESPPEIPQHIAAAGQPHQHGDRRQRGFFQQRLQKLVDRAATLRIHPHPLPITNLRYLRMRVVPRADDDDDASPAASPRKGTAGGAGAAAAKKLSRPEGYIPDIPDCASAVSSESESPQSPGGSPVDNTKTPMTPLTPVIVTAEEKMKQAEQEKKKDILYDYGGPGAYVCRLCLKMGYGRAHHCARCVPTYDVCDECFTKSKVAEICERDPGDDSGTEGGDDPTGEGSSAGTGSTVDPFENISTAWLYGRSTVSHQEALIHAKRGEFTGLLNVLFPPDDQHSLIASEQTKFDYAISDDLSKETLLHLAADAGADRVVLGLLMYIPAEVVNARNYQGLTPLMVACLKGRESVVEELLYNEHVELDARCYRGYTALMLAASRGHGSIASRLLFRGADLNLVSRDGRTALAIAALNGWRDCVRRLLQAGADASIRDSEGYTAIVLAAAKGHSTVVAMFPREAKEALRW